MVEQFLSQELQESMINKSNYLLEISVVPSQVYSTLTTLNDINLSHSSSSNDQMDHNIGR